MRKIAIITIGITFGLLFYVAPSLAIEMEKDVNIIAQHSGKCLDVNQASQRNGAKISQWGCTNAPQQTFRMKILGNSYVKFRAKHSDRCMDLKGPSHKNGARLQQWLCTNGDNQIWRLERVGNGVFKIISKYSGKCLDVKQGSHNDGAHLQQWDCTQAPQQRFIIRAVR